MHHEGSSTSPSESVEQFEGFQLNLVETGLLNRRWASRNLAIEHGHFIDNGTLRATQPFLSCFRRNWRLDSPASSEELLYRAMLIVGEFTPNLGETDFLTIRRLIWLFCFGEHDGLYAIRIFTIDREMACPCGISAKVRHAYL